MIDLSKLEERVILAAVSTSETDQAESSLDELKELADLYAGDLVEATGKLQF